MVIISQYKHVSSHPIKFLKMSETKLNLRVKTLGGNSIKKYITSSTEKLLLLTDTRLPAPSGNFLCHLEGYSFALACDKFLCHS